MALLLPRRMSRSSVLTLMDDARSPHRGPGRDPSDAIRAGLFALRWLARLRTPLWRNTCLYRSVLRTAILRRAGQQAVLRIGAAKGPDGASIAHAWVELAGMPTPDEGLEYTQLQAVRRPGDAAAG